MSTEKPVKVIDSGASFPLVALDFKRSGTATPLPHRLRALEQTLYNNRHIIVQHASPSPRAATTLAFEPQPDLADMETIAMSWTLYYGDDADYESQVYMRRLSAQLTSPDGIVLPGTDGGRFTKIAANDDQEAYALDTPVGRPIDILAVINHTKRLVTVGNAGSIANTEFGLETRYRYVEPAPLSKVSLRDQLQLFGDAVATVGRLAIPGIVPLGAEHDPAG